VCNQIHYYIVIINKENKFKKRIRVNLIIHDVDFFLIEFENNDNNYFYLYIDLVNVSRTCDSSFALGWLSGQSGFKTMIITIFIFRLILLICDSDLTLG
jgi:hypothetical protein